MSVNRNNTAWFRASRVTIGPVRRSHDVIRSNGSDAIPRTGADLGARSVDRPRSVDSSGSAPFTAGAAAPTAPSAPFVIDEMMLAPTTHAPPRPIEESCSADYADGSDVDSFDDQQDRGRQSKPRSRPHSARNRGDSMVCVRGGRDGPVTEGDSRAVVLGTVLIIDDCALYREALASALRSNGIPRVRSAWDLPSLIGALESAAPQVILLNMTADKVHTFLRAARELRPEVPVVAVATPEDDPNIIFACAEAGVATYHMKADSLADLVVLIHLVAEGQTWCPPQIAATLLRRVSAVAGSRRSAPKDSGLTAREIQVLHMLELGWSNQDIARELSIAVHTVKNHVHNLLTKLGSTPAPRLLRRSTSCGWTMATVGA